MGQKHSAFMTIDLMLIFYFTCNGNFSMVTRTYSSTVGTIRVYCKLYFTFLLLCKQVCLDSKQ